MSLPQPNDAFQWTQVDGRPVLTCTPLAAIAPHFFTTRQWALGTEPTRRAGAGPAESEPASDHSWSEVAAAAGVAPSHLARVRQLHGTMVALVKDPQTTLPDGDIVISRNPELALAVQSADCVPILLADRHTGAAGAAHAGWRGLSVRVPGAAVAALVRNLGCNKKDLVAAIGPAIGACCYEVGPDVLERFMRMGFTGDQLERWFQTSPRPSARNPSMSDLRAARDGHWYFDAALSARDQLRGVGVPEEQIFVTDLCTASHAEWLCSYRRDGPPAGRLAAVIRPPRMAT